VVTGVGLVTPLASTRDQTWKELIHGSSGIGHTKHGLEARVIDFSPNGARSRTGDFALMAAEEALDQAGLGDETARAKLSIGCAVSQSKPIFSDHLDATLLMASFSGWTPEALIRKDFKLDGPATNVTAACATGIASIQVGVNWLKAGDCDAVLVGASESSLHPMYRAGFEQMGVLSDATELFHLIGPFDRDRAGFVMGEGSAVLILERKESALKRGATPLVACKKVLLRHSAGDLIRFDDTGSGVAQLLTQVLNGTVPGYINAHGTGTQFNDAVETKGIRICLGKSADTVPVSSTKAATGHLLGAAGAVEAAFAVLALIHQIVPPTLGISTPDPVCDLDYVPWEARPHKFDTALSLSYGFGGQMGAALFERI
jgi:3-oxoacyl-[acyl-carrier-protein] synthase II